MGQMTALEKEVVKIKTTQYDRVTMVNLRSTENLLAEPKFVVLTVLFQ